MNRVIAVRDYDPRWPEQFEKLRARIAGALGDLAAAIEHVGSTAVPGLAAKPIIDIDVLLRSPADLPEAIQRLASLGYQHQGDQGIAGREAFRAPAGEIAHHLYACLGRQGEFTRHLCFRDHLRKHREDARAYAKLKLELARRFGDDRDAYSRAKTDFITNVLHHVGSRTSPP